MKISADTVGQSIDRGHNRQRAGRENTRNRESGLSRVEKQRKAVRERAKARECGQRKREEQREREHVNGRGCGPGDFMLTPVNLMRLFPGTKYC